MKVLVGGVGVDCNRQDRLLAGEPLGEADVFGLEVEACATNVEDSLP
jgi:hypothetical protein